MYKKLSLAGVFALLFLFSSLNAQSLRIGPQVGYQKAQDADKGQLMFGLAARLKVLPMLGAEASINYRQEKYGDGELTIRSWPVMVSGLYYPLPIIYGIVGFGWYNTTFDFSSQLNDAGFADETKQEVGWHFGAGVELPVGSNVRLAGDIRYVFLNYDFKSVPGVGTKNNFYMIAGSLLFGL